MEGDKPASCTAASAANPTFEVHDFSNAAVNPPVNPADQSTVVYV